MAWEILFHDEFDAWFDEQDGSLREAIASLLDVLEEEGPQLGRPYVDTVAESAFPNMKELRVQHKGDPWRILFAFDFERTAVLLVGGNKRGEKRWYKEHIVIADRRFQNSINYKDGEINDLVQGKTETIFSRGTGADQCKS